MAAIYMAAWKPNKKYTFGFLRFEILASFMNGLALVIIAVGIFAEGIRRIITPRAIDQQLMLMISIIGLIVNIVLTIVLSRSTKQEANLNVKSALWHFIGDLLNSVGVIISAILMYYTKVLIFDPLISMIIGMVILVGGAKIIRESYLILMESVPEKFDLDQIRQEMKAIDGVADVHELHLWAVTTDHYSITAHLFIHEDRHPTQVVSSITQMLKEKYCLEHATIQIENPALIDHQQYGKNFLLNHTSSEKSSL